MYSFGFSSLQYVMLFIHFCDCRILSWLPNRVRFDSIRFELDYKGCDSSSDSEILLIFPCVYLEHIYSQTFTFNHFQFIRVHSSPFILGSQKMYKNHSSFWSRFLLLLAFIIRICLSALLLFITGFGTVSAQPHTIVKQICFPNGDVLFISLFSLVKNGMHKVVWGCAKILPWFF